jgi:chemotaxis signal transduction protein
MNEALQSVAGRATKLQLEFDRSFASPFRTDTTTEEHLLAVRLGGRSFAIRLSEITGLFRDKRITPVPGANAALLGIAGFRGSILPVYDLQSLIGQSRSKACRWLVIAAAAPVALAFEAFEGQLRVPIETIVPQQSHDFTRDHVQTPNLVRPIFHLPTVLDAIKA